MLHFSANPRVFVLFCFFRIFSTHLDTLLPPVCLKHSRLKVLPHNGFKRQNNDWVRTSVESDSLRKEAAKCDSTLSIHCIYCMMFPICTRLWMQHSIEISQSCVESVSGDRRTMLAVFISFRLDLELLWRHAHVDNGNLVGWRWLKFMELDAAVALQPAANTWLSPDLTAHWLRCWLNYMIAEFGRFWSYLSYFVGLECMLCYLKVVGSVPLVCMSKCSWARYWTPDCSWCAGLHLVCQPPPSVYECMYDLL